MDRELRIGERSYPVTIVRRAAWTEVVVGETRWRAHLVELGGGEYLLELDGRRQRLWIAPRSGEVWIHAAGVSWRMEVADPLERRGDAPGADGDTAEAPMPGTVVRVMVAPGEPVHRGQPLVVIESMKMETTIVAWRDGHVERLHRTVGETFERRAPLVSLQPEARR